ncbi:MAG: hypothetical protein M9921_11575 [Fimbriimonadaceae bacterium]|nr:hypothetical protein [Fimbriimonadaceae bacterium]
MNKETTRYFCDGQMCFEEDNVEEQAEVVNCTRYGLGARGIDWIETSVSGNPQTSLYPLYDGHGNMIATISLSGTLSNLREYIRRPPASPGCSAGAGAISGSDDNPEWFRYCSVNL